VEPQENTEFNEENPTKSEATRESPPSMGPVADPDDSQVQRLINPPIPIINPKDRLTVVQSFYHSVVGEEATRADGGFSRFLKTSEQCYTRWLKVAEEWIPLDTGWVTEVGLVVIKNVNTKFTQRQPTEEQKAEAAKKVLEVSYTKDSNRSFLIPPGECYPFYPSSPGELFLRCQHGQTRFDLWVYPG
jgi:hypothetical protein